VAAHGARAAAGYAGSWLHGISSVEVSARRADGGAEVLLFAKDFSPWLTPYIFAEPVALKKGTRLVVTAYSGVETTMKTTIATVQ